MEVDEDNLSNQEEKVNKQDIHIKLTPGKDIILTITPDSYGGGVTFSSLKRDECQWLSHSHLYRILHYYSIIYI